MTANNGSAPGTEGPRFLTVAEVAQVLRVSNMTVYRVIAAGTLPAVRIGRSFRVRQEDLDSYLSQQMYHAI